MLEPSQENPPDSPYLYLLEGVDFQPVFIIGSPRSGTTLLYNLLSNTGYFNYPGFYHVIKHDEILFNHINGTEQRAKEELNDLLKSFGLSSRLFDNVEVTANSPEEYGKILESGKNAHHSSTLNPRFLFGSLRRPPGSYRPPRPFIDFQLNYDNTSVFLEFCKKVQYISDVKKPLLLKNPWDSLNFSYVKNVLPKAKFIFIHRHPVHVINSMLKAMRSVLDEKNQYAAFFVKRYSRLFERPARLYLARLLFSPHLGIGVHMATNGMSKLSGYFLQNIHSLRSTDYTSLRYEDLCENPDKAVMEILTFLGFNPDPSVLGFDDQIHPRPLRLLPEVERKYEHIRKKLQSYIAYCGYDA